MQDFDELSRRCARRGTRVALAASLLVLAVSACSDSGSTTARLGPAELAAEVRSSFAEAGSLDRARRLGVALQQLDPENLNQVRSVYDEYLHGLGELELRPFFDAWARFDGPAAFAYARRRELMPAVAETLREAAIHAWASHDLPAAKRAVDQLAEQSPRVAPSLYRPLVEGWALSGQPGLEAYILSSAEPGPLLFIAIPQIYQREGPDGLLHWSQEMIRQSSDYAGRMQTLRMTARQVALRKPEAVIPFVLEHAGEEYGKYGLITLMEAWLRKDHQAAFEWLRTGAPEASRADTLGQVVTTWLTIGKGPAREWIESLPLDDPFYQPAFYSMAGVTARRDPETAIGWCNRGQNGPGYRDCLREVASRWYLRDPVAAGNWLEKESPLSVEERIEVRESAARKGGRRNRRMPEAQQGDAPLRDS